MVKWSFNKMDKEGRTVERTEGQAGSFEVAHDLVEGCVDKFGPEGSSGLVWSEAEAEVCEPMGGALNWSPCGVPAS